jgi:AcrR family transcriptional regulator
MAAFGTDGFHATSLDALASTLGVTKQTVLHHFGSKDGVLAATTEAAATLLSDAVETALLKPGNPDERLVRVVHGVFALAARRPELLGFVRDLSRLGSTPLANLRVALAPFLTRASAFVEEEMFVAAAQAHRQAQAVSNDPANTANTANLARTAYAPASEPASGIGDENTKLRDAALDIVLAAYAAVLAAAAEVEVLRSLGVNPSGRLFLRRRREVIEYLQALSANVAGSMLPDRVQPLHSNDPSDDEVETLRTDNGETDRPVTSAGKRK